ncbi:fimbria/pilus outer membrane usher protein [Chromobacterium haemolyticum]|uniref:PapC N-terminal domain-containing protein n=1 Tax=Chromobacterium haemolyticum TaxID=394935 RepID=A0A1W0CAB0_9NEIS|nr:fimbria/pilus outer membrane usher protein [Chromobacterium haemolyticum]OQS31666.1 hypothetical protein B0T45_22650 [Chromobacterium haemolyticum]
MMASIKNTMSCDRIVFFKLKRIATSIIFGLFWAPASAEKLDFSFMQGGGETERRQWKALEDHPAAGLYYLDVSLNERKTGRYTLKVSMEDENGLCLSMDWLKKAKIFIDEKYFRGAYDSNRLCYVLSKANDTRVELDIATQSLSLTLPQISLVDIPVDTEWDYGVTALKLNYNGNFNVDQLGINSFAAGTLSANLGQWTINGNATASSGSREVSVVSASKPLKSIGGDLVIGKVQAGSSLLGNASIYGAMLSSNNSMRPNEIGYSPVFSGVAKSYARVTLMQAGSTIYSEPIPPGPFAIRNAKLLNSGDVTMIISEENGEKSHELFPLTVMTGLLTPGKSSYSLSFGKQDKVENSQQALGSVFSASYGYGLSDYTVKGDALLNSYYQGFAVSMASNLGKWGGVSVSGAYARALYEKQKNRQGSIGQLNYSNSFQSGTNLRIGWSRKLSQDYIDFSNLISSYSSNKQESKNLVRRNQLNININHNLNRKMGFGFSGWRRDYWQSNRVESGYSGTLTTQIKGISLSLGASVNRSSRGSSRQLSVLLSTSIPLMLFERKVSTFGSIRTALDGGASVSGGLSAPLDERTSISSSSSLTTDRNIQSSLSGSYSGDKANLAMNINQSPRSTTGSVSITGSVLALPTKSAVILSREATDTVAVINVKNTGGVKVIGGSAESDENGNLVVPLNSYQNNLIAVDSSTLPNSVELNETSQSVIPSHKSVTWIDFDTKLIQRYIFQIRKADGSFVPSGTWAYSKDGGLIGFIAQNGVLMINAEERLDELRVGDQCMIGASKIEHVANLQEVVCE